MRSARPMGRCSDFVSIQKKRFARRRQRRLARLRGVERLEPRTLLATDLAPQALEGTGQQLDVLYQITGDPAAPFDVGLYRSADGIQLDGLLTTHRVTNVADLSPGSHLLSIVPDFVDGETDYHLIVVLDSNAEIPESIETNNRAMFSAGVFQTANGTVMVHGTESADAIMVQDLFTTCSPLGRHGPATRPA